MSIVLKPILVHSNHSSIYLRNGLLYNINKTECEVIPRKYVQVSIVLINESIKPPLNIGDMCLCVYRMFPTDDYNDNRIGFVTKIISDKEVEVSGEKELLNDVHKIAAINHTLNHENKVYQISQKTVESIVSYFNNHGILPPYVKVMPEAWFDKVHRSETLGIAISEMEKLEKEAGIVYLLNDEGVIDGYVETPIIFTLEEVKSLCKEACEVPKDRIDAWIKARVYKIPVTLTKC